MNQSQALVCLGQSQSEASSAAPFLGDPLVQAAVEAIVMHVVLILQVNVIVACLDDLGRFFEEEKDVPDKSHIHTKSSSVSQILVFKIGRSSPPSS